MPSRRTNLVWGRGAAVVTVLGLLGAGCGGGGGSSTASSNPQSNTNLTPSGTGSGTPTGSSSPSVQPTGEVGFLRPIFGQSVDPVALDDRQVHPYRFPGVPGTSYQLALDTTPSGAELEVEVIDFAGNVLISETVTTPLTRTITAQADAQLEVRVFDPRQVSGQTLSSLVVTPTQQAYDPSRFRVFVHICGDSFAGLGAYNDLAAPSDGVAFASDLLSGANLILPPGVQIDVGNSGTQRLTNAQVAAVEPDLVSGGRTVLPDDFDQQEALCDGLGIPASDPDWGRALDLFVLHSPNPNSPTVTGQCACTPVGQGGLFEGTGRHHSLVIRLFDRFGNPRTMDELQSTLAHELGHFLSLFHTTEPDFTPDDLPDTPAADPLLHDADNDGQLGPSETGPDTSYVMFPYVANKTLWSPGQVSAMRDYLSVRPH